MGHISLSLSLSLSFSLSLFLFLSLSLCKTVFNFQVRAANNVVNVR